MSTILVNRAPVLTLWGAVVAERLGHDRAEALTLGKAVAGLNALSKGRRLGIFEEAKPAPKPKARGRKPPERAAVPLLGRMVPITRTPDGLRAVVKDRAESPAAVERYLAQKFGEALPRVEAAMRTLAWSYRPAELAAKGFELYEAFRPRIPEGVKGWGAKGVLDLGLLARL